MVINKLTAGPLQRSANRHTEDRSRAHGLSRFRSRRPLAQAAKHSELRLLAFLRSSARRSPQLAPVRCSSHERLHAREPPGTLTRRSKRREFKRERFRRSRRRRRHRGKNFPCHRRYRRLRPERAWRDKVLAQMRRPCRLRPRQVDRVDPPRPHRWLALPLRISSSSDRGCDIDRPNRFWYRKRSHRGRVRTLHLLDEQPPTSRFLEVVQRRLRLGHRGAPEVRPLRWRHRPARAVRTRSLRQSCHR